MYKLITAIFLIVLAVGFFARSFDLSVYKDGYYLRYEFPRYAKQTWFEVTLGKRQGLTGILDEVKNKASQ